MNSPTAMVTVSMTKIPSMVNTTCADSPRPRMVKIPGHAASAAPMAKRQNQ